MASTAPLVLSLEGQLGIADILAVAREGRPVELDPDSRFEIDRRRKEIEDWVGQTKQPTYGFNRGFGHNQKVAVPEERLIELQRNLIRSHSSGAGDPADVEAVRATMLLRAASLARGHSGVRSLLIDSLLSFLNAGVTPLVPRLGSCGASGDLAPLSHVALALIGEGQVFVPGHDSPRDMTDADVKAELDELGVQTVVLQMKEGLALTNGIQFSTALGCLAADAMRNLLEHAAIATALAAQVMLGSDAPFREDLHDVRPHPGGQRVARWIWDLLQDSPIREFHRRYDVDGEVQDPYSLRCAAQILGACAELIDDAEVTLTREINSVTDNPILLQDEESGAFTDVVSGGHFHGMPVATRLYGLFQAMGIMARLSNMRSARYVDESRNKGMPSDLVWPELPEDERTTCSGLMIAEYTAASLTNWVWGACMPNHLLSISTDAGQEDHTSMCTNLAVRALETIPRLTEILSIELAFASQAAEVRKAQVGVPTRIRLRDRDEDERAKYAERYMEDGVTIRWDEADRRLSPCCEAVVERIQRTDCFPRVEKDRPLFDDIARLSALVERGELVTIAGATLTAGGRGGRFPSTQG
ncbi:MAG: aromatic amino acid lyase [Candidatus Eisenbacteria bacterium]|uniref:Aromatic amino acid lyase n=1 Tax=Eiseniibacteriota bacterium TaxID=2212470 RepID=A0A956N9X3_UNCEI|nr:aromatic amino acid lyase [Candidatus Eisenbacteria bacterium]